MYKYIAFDLGYTFGWFDGTNGGTIKLKKTVKRNKRHLDFYNHVLNLLVLERKGEPYKAIVFEDAFNQHPNAMFNFFGQKYILTVMAEALNLELIGYHVTSIKKSFTGYGGSVPKGTDKKKPVMNECKKRKIKVDDHNHADAVATWYTHRDVIAVPSAETLKAYKEAEDGDFKDYKSFKDLVKELNE